MMMGCRFVCDFPECKSTLELSAPQDLRNIETALGIRGWASRCVPDGGPKRHVCPIHATIVDREGWAVVGSGVRPLSTPVPTTGDK